MQSVLLATAITTVAASYGAPAPVAETTTAPAAVDVQYYYGDYDNVAVAGTKSLWYSSALNKYGVARAAGAAVDATTSVVDASGKSSSASWGAAVNLNIDQSAVYNLKGATFCGAKDQYGKYSQLFVADAGTDKIDGAVYGWTVTQDEANPAAVKLSNKWTVYQQDGAAVTDVECGPKDGLFVADKGQNAVYWITNANLKQADAAPAYEEVVPADCGAAVAEVRSLNYNAQTGQLAWTNNAASVDAAAIPDTAAGVFQYDVGQQVQASASCEQQACDAWSQDCSSDIEQVVAPEGNATAPQYWAVAQSWGEVQVSQGDKNLYEAGSMEVVASVAKEVTYAQPTDAARNNALLVADQQAGTVSAVTQEGKVSQVAKGIKDPYGVAYNAGNGWTPAEASASAVVMSVGAVLAALALLF